MKRINGKFLAVDIAECAIFAALMVAGAYITIPIPVVPLTFQTVISVLAGLLLGWKKGAISMSVYCITGLIGIPVFSQGGGIFYVVKPSFGYIIGFIAAAAVAGAISGKSGLPLWRYIVGALAGFVADYIVGIPYCLVAAYLSNPATDLWKLFLTGGLIFMPKDAILSVLAALLAWRVVPYIERSKRRSRADGD